MKPPYDSGVTLKIRESILIGLSLLKETGRGNRRWINFEDILKDLENLISNLNLIELNPYLDYWYNKFRDESSHKKRYTIFHEFITDLVNKGLFPSQIPPLTGNLKERIEKILEKSSIGK